jgi:hypothetical protein
MILECREMAMDLAKEAHLDGSPIFSYEHGKMKKL